MSPLDVGPILLQRGGGVVLVLLIFLLITGLWLYASYWVYSDARRRGSRHAAAWGVGVFLIGFIGLLLYLVVRDDLGPNRGGRAKY